jgi:taurine dioxygenase
MHVKAMTSSLGAEITDIDLSKPMSDETYRTLKQAFLDHGVIVVKHQDMTTDQFTAFGQRFGSLRPHPLVRRQHPNCPTITVLGIAPAEAKSQQKGKEQQQETDWEIDLVGWHADLAYEKVAAVATAVLSQEVPKSGGDMLFCRQLRFVSGTPQRSQSTNRRTDSHVSIRRAQGVSRGDRRRKKQDPHRRTPGRPRALRDWAQGALS